MNKNYSSRKFVKIKGEPKIFVFDTNVIMHDYRSIYNFQDNDIYIPISVIEELDKFKKGNETKNYNSREFVRALDSLSNNSLFSQGVSLGKGKGNIKVEMGHPYSQQLKDSLKDDFPDHRIIATTMWLKENNPTKKVILVTKDINMRLKAKALGLMAQDYLAGQVKEKTLKETQKEVIIIKNLSSEQIEKLTIYKKVEPKEIGLRNKPQPNQLYKIQTETQENILCRYDKKEDRIIVINKGAAYGITPRNDEQAFALDAVLNPNIKLVSITGMAGSGKTLLALAGALAQADNFSQILLSRPVIPLKNQELGFLPGSVEDKIGPYMLPLFDNLTVIKSAFSQSSKEVVKIEEMLRKEKLVINPLAYIRGRSLTRTIFIIDESQNLTPHEVKTIITRAGEGTKLIFTGDIFQIDQPYLDIHSNGLSHLSEKLYGQEIFEHINLRKGERSKLSEIAGKLL